MAEIKVNKIPAVPAPPPTYEVTLTLTEAETVALRLLTGSVDYNVYEKLDGDSGEYVYPTKDDIRSLILSINSELDGVFNRCVLSSVRLVVR